MPYSGRCNCGHATYEVLSEPIVTYVCHCFNCQKRSGSAFGMGIIVPVDDLKLQGELSCWKRVSDTGNTSARYSCAICGNVIYGVGTFTPGLVKVLPGTLDDTANLQPEVHVWTKNAQKWVQIPSDIPQYSEQPESMSEVMKRVADYRRRRDHVKTVNTSGISPSYMSDPGR